MKSAGAFIPNHGEIMPAGNVHDPRAPARGSAWIHPTLVLEASDAVCALPCGEERDASLAPIFTGEAGPERSAGCFKSSEMSSRKKVKTEGRN